MIPITMKKGNVLAVDGSPMIQDENGRIVDNFGYYLLHDGKRVFARELKYIGEILTDRFGWIRNYEYPKKG